MDNNYNKTLKTLLIYYKVVIKIVIFKMKVNFTNPE